MIKILGWRQEVLRIRKQISLLALAGLFLSTTPLFAQPANLSQEQVVKFAQQSFPEYLQLLNIPSDAAVPADIQKTAEFIASAFQKRGFSTKLLENQGKPMVYAELNKSVPGAKTILFYMHMVRCSMSGGCSISRMPSEVTSVIFPIRPWLLLVRALLSSLFKYF